MIKTSKNELNNARGPKAQTLDCSKGFVSVFLFFSWLCMMSMRVDKPKKVVSFA